jgi:hypothetical protein
VNHNLSPAQFADLGRQMGEGGFSVNVQTGQPADKPGFMVSRHGREERYGPDEAHPYHPGVLPAYVEKHLGALSEPETYFGGWKAGRASVLDVSDRIVGLVPASRAMFARQQEAMYNLDRGEEIPNYLHPRTREKLHQAASLTRLARNQR